MQGKGRRERREGMDLDLSPQKISGAATVKHNAIVVCMDSVDGWMSTWALLEDDKQRAVCSSW